MESDDGVNGSNGDDDGLLDEDIAGGEEDDILDDTELDYTEDILEEANEEQVNDENTTLPQDCSQCISEPSSPLDVEEGEISSEEETADKTINLSVKLKNRAADKSGKIKTKKIRFTGMASRSLSSSNSSSSNSMVCRHYLAGTCDWGKECRFYHPPRGVVQGAHSDRHFPLYPPPDVLHHMSHPPEFLGLAAAAAHFHPPMMPLPPHIIPGPGMPPIPHPQFGTPFHPVPIIPFHEPWRLPPPGPRHIPPFREHYERMAAEAGKHGSQLEESATWVRLKTKVSRADYHGDLRSKLKGVPAMDDQSESDSDESARRNRKVDKKSKKKSSNGSSNAKQKSKKTKKTHTSNKRTKKDEDRNSGRYSKQEDTVSITKKDSRRNEEKNKSPPAKRRKEDKQKKRHSSEEGLDVTPPNLSPSSPGAHEFGYSHQLDSSDTLTSKKKDDLKWSFKIGDEKQRRLQEELKVVDNAIKRRIAAKRR